jgi:hypothetical protein
LRLELFPTQRVVTANLAANLLVLFDLWQRNDHGTKLALDLEGINDLLDNAGSASYLDVSVAHGAIPVQNEPVLNAKLAKQFVAIVAFFWVPREL